MLDQTDAADATADAKSGFTISAAFGLEFAGRRVSRRRDELAVQSGRAEWAARRRFYARNAKQTIQFAALAGCDPRTFKPVWGRR